MRKTVALPFAALALASVIAAGCSGNGYNAATATGTPTPIPTTLPACTPPPAPEQVQMVFPQNGSTNAANTQGVVFAVSPSPLPTNWYFYATSTFGTTGGTNTIGFLATPSPAPTASGAPTATPLPTPSDTPLFANPIYETASLGKFASGTTKFTIFLANTNCFPGITMSTFTTSLNDSPTPTPTPAPTGT
jgi:hypothetical protein